MERGEGGTKEAGEVHGEEQGARRSVVQGRSRDLESFFELYTLLLMRFCLTIRDSTLRATRLYVCSSVTPPTTLFMYLFQLQNFHVVL